MKAYLEYVAALKGLTKKETGRKVGELLERLALAAVKNKKINKLSGGNETKGRHRTGITK